MTSTNSHQKNLMAVLVFFFYNSSLYYKKILDFKIKNRYSVPIELVYNSIGTL